MLVERYKKMYCEKCDESFDMDWDEHIPMCNAKYVEACKTYQSSEPRRYKEEGGCGAVLGHGLTCCSGVLCGPCRKVKELESKLMKTETLLHFTQKHLSEETALLDFIIETYPEIIDELL